MTIATPVMCRNRMAGPTVIASDQKSTHEVIFQGAGDPDGNDVQYIPEEILKTPQFARAIRQKIFEVVQGDDNEAVQAALQHQSDAFWGRMEKDKDEALASLDQQADNDLISVNCIGPGSRSGAVCGENVPVRQREAMNLPPLCSRHQSFSDECFRKGTGPWQLDLDKGPVSP